MKPHRKNLLLLGAISLTLATPSAYATDLYWDINGVIVGSGGTAPSGSWGTSGTTWSTDSTGGTATTTRTTSGIDDLFFSAGTNATGSYTVTLAADQNAKSLTFQEGAATITANKVTLTGGGITVLTGSGNPIISSNLSLNGNHIFNVGTGRFLTLNTGAFTRGTRATANFQGAGNSSSTMTGLSLNVNNIIGPWASIGTGAATTYAKFSGSNITGLGYVGGADGLAVATSNLVVTGAGNLNYSLAAAGTLGANASVNSLRFTGPTGGTLSSNTSFTTDGIMLTGAGNTTLLGGGTWSSGAAATELVINVVEATSELRMTGATASITGSINKTGAGIFDMRSGAAHAIGNITVNQGTLITNHLNADGIGGSATITPGGTLRWGGNNKHNNGAVFTINAGGTLDIRNLNDTIGGLSGSGTVTGLTNGYMQISNGETFSGNITGAIGIRTSATTSDQSLNGASDYSEGTIITAGLLTLGNSTAAGSGTIQLGATSDANTAELRLNGSGTNVANAMTVNDGSAGAKTLANQGTNTVIYSGNITANDNLTVLSANTAGRLTVSGVANTIATGKTVDFSNTGTTTNATTDSALWDDLGSISYTSSSATGFIINGAKTYSGGAALGAMSGAGVVAVGTSSTGPANAPTNGAFGTGTLSIGATKMQAATTGGDITIGNPVTFTDSPAFATVLDEKSLIFSGNAALGATRTLTVETGSTTPGTFVEFSGEISGITFGITKAGAGTLRLSGINTYTGDTTVNAGVLAVTGTSIENTGTLVIDGGTVNLTNTEIVNKLFFGVVEQPSGEYSASGVPGGATITAASFSGGGTLTVGSAGSAYSIWAATHAPITGANPDADEDADGVSNVVEFVLGGTISTNDLGKLPTPAVSGGNMTFTFNRAVSSIDPKTTVTIEVSTDLLTWNTPPSPYAVPDAATGPVNPGVTVVEDTSPGYDTITLTVPKDTATKFVRIKATQTP